MTNSPYTNSPSNVSFETNFNVSFETNFNAGQATSAAETKQIVIKEIRAKWGKFSEDEAPGQTAILLNRDGLPRAYLLPVSRRTRPPPHSRRRDERVK